MLKAKNRLPYLLYLKTWLRHQGRWVLIGITSVLISGGLTLLILTWVRQVLSAWPDVALTVEPSTWLGLGFLLLGRALFGFLGAYGLGHLAARAITDVRQRIFARLVHAAVPFHDRHWSADLVSALTSDAAFVEEALGRVLPVLALHVPIAAITLILLWQVNANLLLGLLLAGLPLVLLVFLGGRAIRRVTSHGQTLLGQVAVAAQEGLLGVRLIQTLQREEFFADRFAQLTEAHWRLKLRRVMWQAVLENVAPIGVAALALYGLWFVQRQLVANETTPAQLAIFVAYLTVFSGSALPLLRAYTAIEPMIGALQRLIALQQQITQTAENSATHPPTTLATQQTKVTGRVVFKQVTFTYPEERGGVYDVSLQIEPGQFVAILGPNGAGKSTLIQLLLRFYEPQQGEISVSGRCTAEVPLAEWRRQFALVTRDPHIFSLSLADNIRLGRLDATQAEVEAAARRVGLHEFIAGLPGGYTAQVGESGVRLSAGQRQRLALARVFLQDPAVIILDEATVSLDLESERTFRMAIEEWVGVRVILLIAHATDAQWPINRTIQMQNGQVVSDTDNGNISNENAKAHFSSLK